MSASAKLAGQAASATSRFATLIVAPTATASCPMFASVIPHGTVRTFRPRATRWICSRMIQTASPGTMITALSVTMGTTGTRTPSYAASVYSDMTRCAWSVHMFSARSASGRIMSIVRPRLACRMEYSSSLMSILTCQKTKTSSGST